MSKYKYFCLWDAYFQMGCMIAQPQVQRYKRRKILVGFSYSCLTSRIKTQNWYHCIYAPSDWLITEETNIYHWYCSRLLVQLINTIFGDCDFYCNVKVFEVFTIIKKLIYLIEQMWFLLRKKNVYYCCYYDHIYKSDYLSGIFHDVKRLEETGN